MSTDERETMERQAGHYILMVAGMLFAGLIFLVNFGPSDFRLAAIGGAVFGFALAKLHPVQGDFISHGIKPPWLD